MRNPTNIRRKNIPSRRTSKQRALRKHHVRDAQATVSRQHGWGAVKEFQIPRDNEKWGRRVPERVDGLAAHCKDVGLF